MILRLTTLLLVLALSACGFHLRDAMTLPYDLDPVKVVSRDRYSPLAERLAQALTRAGAVPATDATENPAVLDLLVEKWGDTPISVDERGRAQEYSLRYAVVFELRNGDGTVLVPRQNIELARDYISVPEASIGTEGERDILVRELQREMAASVLRRIDAVVAEGDVASGEEVFGETTDAARAAMEAANALPLPGADVDVDAGADADASAEPAQPDPATEPDPEPVDPEPVH